MSPAERMFFLFIALHLMQNPIGWCCGWLKIPELALRIFSQSQHQMSRQRHFASSARVFLGFWFISGHRIFVTTPHYFNLSSYQFGGEKCTAPCLQGVSKEFVLIAKAME